MTDTAEQTALDHSELDETDPSAIRWLGLPILFWSIALSLALHGLGAAPFLIWEFAPNGQSFDTEWVQQFDDLEGIGHGANQGRWANLDDLPAPQDDAPDEPEVKTEPEPEPKKEPEPKPEPKKEPEPEPKKEPEPKADAKPEPKKEPEPKKKPAPKTDSATKAPTKTAANDSTPTQKASANRGPFRPDKPLPGLDRAGPSNIPNLKNYGPGNARVTALVRLDRVRGTLYEEGVRQIMQAVPDFRILAHSTGFDPIDDIDSFFMASAKPQYIQHTFLAVRHHKSQQEIKDVLDRRFRDPVPWEKKGEYAVRRLVPADSKYWDPRKIMLARPGLTIVGKDKWLNNIAENLPKDSPLRAEPSSAGQDAAAPQATLLDGLAQIERAAQGDDTMVMMSAQGLVYIIPGLGRMKFEGVRLKVTNPKSPTVDVDLKFTGPDKAKKFAQSCPALRARLKKAMGLTGGFASFATNAMGLGDVVDKLKCRADEDYVNIHAVYTAQQVKTLANFAAPWIPRPQALNELPPPPPRPKPAAAPDAGGPAPDQPDAGGLAPDQPDAGAGADQ